jgi:hypothetical protein
MNIKLVTDKTVSISGHENGGRNFEEFSLKNVEQI